MKPQTVHVSYNRGMFITTAIHYTNGNPHIGHAFEFIVSDVVVRWHRMKGKDVWFLTGTDEHGQKIEKTAEAQGITPLQLCDKNSAIFKELCDKLDIQYSRFIRTTDDDHISMVAQFYNSCKKTGDIYKGLYVGWYNVREETFVTNKDAELNDFKDPETNNPLTKMEEECYFFRMSKYASQVLEYLKENPDTVVPRMYGAEIISRLQNEDMKIEDLCITRPKSSLKWGIPVPHDPEHVFYVWFDALVNYMSGAPESQEHWCGDIQVIGKDIVWFHTMIWFSMLFSVKSVPPKKLFVHGFICDQDGKKMSKSVGNVVDPFDLIQKYGDTATRYYLINDFNPGTDFRFCEDTLVRQHDSMLLKNLGNYISRVFSMVNKYSNSMVPKYTSDAAKLFDITQSVTVLNEFMDRFELHNYSEHVFGLITKLNAYISDGCIWQIDNEKYPDDKRSIEFRDDSLRIMLEGVYIVCHLIDPIIPKISTKIFKMLRVLPTSIAMLNWNNLKHGDGIEPHPAKLFSIINTQYSGDKMKKNMEKRKIKKGNK